MLSHQLPVLLIVFNRPHYVKKLIDALREAKPVTVYVFSDWAREWNVKDRDWCFLTKQLIEKEIDRECSVKTLYLNENLWPKKALCKWITRFFDNVEYWVVLEEDCIPHKDFFSFSAACFKNYKDNTHFWYVSGLNMLWNELSIDKLLLSRLSILWWWWTTRANRKDYDNDLKGQSLMKVYKSCRSNLLPWYMTLFWLVTYLKIRYNFANTWDGQFHLLMLSQQKIQVRSSKNLINNIWVEGFFQKKASFLNNIPTSSFLIKNIDFPQLSLSKSYNFVYEKNTYYGITQCLKDALYSSISMLLKLLWIHKYIFTK